MAHEPKNTSAKRPRLLAIDDEPENLDLIVRALRRDYQVETVPTAEAALDFLLRAPTPDLAVILADQRLPGMSGVELLAEAARRVPGVRRIIITAYADMEVTVDAINHGHVHHFIKKPWEPSELVTVIASVLEFGRLEAENSRLVAELRKANDDLRDSQSLLAASLDERGRELLSRTRELEAANRELAVLAYRDGLTGLYNHRTFQERLREEVARARRYQQPLSLLFGDLDHFKGYNDALGHLRGDEALRLVARILSGGDGGVVARESDVVARYGGEEFVLLLPETTREGACVKAERLREAVAGTRFPGKADETSSLTISFGVAVYPDDAATADDLIAAADRAAYAAKRMGRNRVCGAERAPAPARSLPDPGDPRNP